MLTVAGGHGGVQPLEVAHVVVGDEQVDELAHRARLVEQAIAETRVRRSRLAITSARVAPSTCTVEAPPDMGRRVVGIRTVTAMRQTLPTGSGFHMLARTATAAARP